MSLEGHNFEKNLWNGYICTVCLGRTNRKFNFGFISFISILIMMERANKQS